ncbi:hypothetical protein ACFV06_33160 [Streptomyces sp. NPDC059618]|uniref:hypothetical protein n=1 Tax=Streptomyces sp. NPDC059618 TaxID=3346887 RepID=UPI0036955E2E
MHTTVFLLRSVLGLGGALVFMWEQDRQASGPGWRKPRVFAAAAAVLLATLLGAYA